MGHGNIQFRLDASELIAGYRKRAEAAEADLAQAIKDVSRYRKDSQFAHAVVSQRVEGKMIYIRGEAKRWEKIARMMADEIGQWRWSEGKNPNSKTDPEEILEEYLEMEGTPR